MRKDIEQLKKLAYEEAANLIFETTPEEKERLYREDIDYRFSDSCIYGRLTGDCFNRRASELIVKCCRKVCKQVHSAFEHFPINGKPNMKKISDRKQEYYSPIEVYIAGADEDEINRLRDYIATGDLT